MLKSCRDDADEMEVKGQDRSDYKYRKACLSWGGKALK